MKISKSKLRQIIKEELSCVSEGDSADRKWASNPRNPGFEGDESNPGAVAEARGALERIWNVINEYEGDAASVYERAERILPRIEKLAAELEHQFDMAPQSDVDYQMDLDQAMMDAGHWQEEN